jgi:hypothetical protein
MVSAEGLQRGMTASAASGMRTLHSIVYPELAPEASAFIERLRTAHDPQHGSFGAHFPPLLADVAPTEPCLRQALDRVYGGTRDPAALQLLGRAGHEGLHR